MPYFFAAPVHVASLPGGAEQDGADGGDQAGVGVADDQLHPGQAAGLERAQERGLERAVLAVTDGEAEDFATAVGGDAGDACDHDDGLGDHPPIDAGLAVGGVQEQIREALAGQ